VRCDGRGACSPRCAPAVVDLLVAVTFSSHNVWSLPAVLFVRPLAPMRCQGFLPNRPMPAVLQRADLVSVGSSAGLIPVAWAGLTVRTCSLH
jgi:hypothetical protein